VIALFLVPAVGQAQEVNIDLASQQTVPLAQGEGRVLRFAAPVESLLVADPEVADVRVVSQGVAYVYGKSSGSTNLIALGSGQQVRGSVSLQVSPALKGAGTAGVSSSLAGRSPLALGNVDNVEQATRLASALSSQSTPDVPATNLATYAGSPQVNIRVRFAEVSRQKLLSYGVNWSALVNTGNFSFGLITGGPLSQGAAAGATNLISGGFASSNANVDVLLDALQSNGILEILAEPNITAMTGQTASFLAGGEIPVPVPVNRDLVGIEYKPYGVSLTFTPTLLPGRRIALQVRPEVSTLASNSTVEIVGVTVPTFQVRRADTSVEVGSGQTFAIAGLFQRNNSQDVDKLPLLGDMPVLGNLFRSKRFQQNETELVILITPYLVQPTSERDLATPLDPADENPAWQMASQGRQLTQSEFGFNVE
jgi:pilus assembly protein CpaC